LGEAVHPVTVPSVVALLLWLIWLLLGVSSSTSSASGTATVTARPAQAVHVAVTIDGRAVTAEQTIVLRRGEKLGFVRGVRAVTLKRLECHRDVHHIALAHRSWRVPDLPTGLYELNGQGKSFGFSYLVRVHSHAAPCPGP